MDIGNAKLLELIAPQLQKIEETMNEYDVLYSLQLKVFSETELNLIMRSQE